MAPLFKIKRAAMSRFGLLTYGISVNAYVVNDDGSISVWMQRRSLTSSKFPGKIDTFVSFYNSPFSRLESTRCTGAS